VLVPVQHAIRCDSAEKSIFKMFILVAYLQSDFLLCSRPVFLKLSFTMRCQRFRETKIRNGGRVLLGVQNCIYEYKNENQF
jgi:hypothetical protein